MFGCSNLEQDKLFSELSADERSNSLTSLEAEQKFAVLLSKAVSNSQDVRTFIKEEAIKRFDNEYDVFYPFAKEKIVANNQTFRDILLSYCDSEDELLEIEKKLLLLNIYVPDLTLFWDFNAHLWDANDSEVSVICEMDTKGTVYEDGESIGDLPLGEIPGFPCLVIKANKRLKVTENATKSGGVSYEFIDDMFDGSNQPPMTRDASWYEDFEATDESGPYVPASELDSKVIEAYKEFGTRPGTIQRDYIYYGITNNNKNGVLDYSVSEKIYKLRIPANAFINLVDDASDPVFNTSTSQEKRYLSDEELLSRIWSGGSFLIDINTYQLNRAGENQTPTVIRYDIKARELFSIKRVHIHHRNSTWFRRSKNTYTVDVNDLRPKWYYPPYSGTGITRSNVTNSWDLYHHSMSIFMDICEYDKDVKYTKTFSVKTEYATQVDTSVEAGVKVGVVTLGGKVGVGITSSESKTNTLVAEYTEGSDHIGSFSYNYRQPVIVGGLTAKGYKVNTYNIGRMEFMIIPTRAGK